MTNVDVYVSNSKPCISEWVVSHGFALGMAFCFLFWGAVAVVFSVW